MAREPRFTGSFWVGHGVLMAEIANKLWTKDIIGAAKVISDNPLEAANLATAFLLALRNAGYNEDGTPANSVDPTAANAPFHWSIVAKPDESWCERINGPCRVSVAVLDGNQIFVGYSATRDQYIEGQAGGANGTYMVHVPRGTWWINVKMGEGMSAQNASVDGLPE